MIHSFCKSNEAHCADDIFDFSVVFCGKNVIVKDPYARLERLNFYEVRSLKVNGNINIS